MDAKQYLSVALGGNMNVGTLTPLAIADLMESYLKHGINQSKEPVQCVDCNKNITDKEGVIRHDQITLESEST